MTPSWGALLRWLDRPGDVPVKKYFYALRPALAVRALRLNPSVRPPMNLQKLLQVVDLPRPMIGRIELLVEAKARTNEMSNGLRAPELEALIADELGRVGDIPAMSMHPDAADRANGLFLELVNI
ncbi:DNA polymerase beta superfamily protein [Edaphosphingomonas haloaromaticamans]|uniref:Putative nucleotidyltransferase n=1 Tax=Edaphosphingomonas haloaromaticamans TaxID=653954 RepID=A0A1S1HAF5_9SPHN|nr:nucleotidyltransferase domain-containing protein [Sphingomonas haloaromaticamans]OHT19124.1 putative nucleotidyltransferase [Sphingomonas haloaromaticamans]